jgi:SAM-dependent methyltransferase
MKLNIGSSSCHLDGWVNLEYDEQYWKKHKFSGERISPKATRAMPDAFGDATRLDKYADNTFDEIRSSHVLEHIPQSKTIGTIKEWYRILKPGGIVRIVVPDILFLIGKLINKEDNKEWWDVQLSDKGLYCDSERREPFRIVDDAFVHLIFLNGHHLNAFTFDLLEYYMKTTGFKNIERCDKEEEDIPDCTVCDYSIRLRGLK